MVNEDFRKFHKAQQEHQGKYIGADRKQRYEVKDPEYNNQKDTDKSVGATGREIE